MPPLSSTANVMIHRNGSRVSQHHATLEKISSICGGQTEVIEIPSYEEEILKYLAFNSRDSPSSLLEQFHIQGWRWHTKSFARDARRLHRLALKTNVKTAETLKDASDYVIGFNMMGLHKIEATLFFPWMREKLTGGLVVKPKVSTSFSSAMDALETDRRTVAQLGKNISEKATYACDTRVHESRRSEAIIEIADHSRELFNLVQRMMFIENTLLVPAVGVLVPAREQKSFNNKVLRKLGLLDSRLHLVGMYDTVWEENDSKEKELFTQAIPGVSRKMIPRWRRKLYQPKTYMME